MGKSNKFFCTILTLIIMLGCMGSTVLAVSSITELKATLTDPAVGKKRTRGFLYRFILH